MEDRPVCVGAGLPGNGKSFTGKGESPLPVEEGPVGGCLRDGTFRLSLLTSK